MKMIFFAAPVSATDKYALDLGGRKPGEHSDRARALIVTRNSHLKKSFLSSQGTFPSLPPATDGLGLHHG